MKILIVGGGIGGLTLAAFLEGSKIKYEIVEKAVEPPAGYLLVMWDNARDILSKLGLAEKFDTFGTQIRTYSIRDGAGKVLRNYNLKDFYVNYGTAMTTLARKDLCQWLSSEIPPSKLTLGLAVTGVAQKGDGVEVTFSDGTAKIYDAVIGADGVHSSVRSLVFTTDAESYENWRSWWVWIDRKFTVPATVTEYLGAGELVLVCSAGDRTLAILNAPADHKVWDTPEGRLERLREVFKDEPEVLTMLAGKQDADAMPSDLLEVKLKEWVKGRVALLGDAAHSFGPHAGLGASMAMEDAYVLAGELLQAEEGGSIEQAFVQYEGKRRTRLAAAKRLNGRMKMGTFIKSKLLRGVVNAAMPYLPESFLVSNYNRLLKEEI